MSEQHEDQPLEPLPEPVPEWSYPVLDDTVPEEVPEDEPLKPLPEPEPQFETDPELPPAA